MSWLWNSMAPEVSDTCMFLPTAKAIWDTLHQTYSKVNDSILIYDIKMKTIWAKQRMRTVRDVNFLQNHWQELDYYRTPDSNCSKCAVVIKKFIKRDWFYDYLAGLNSDFDLVRNQIMGGPEFPSLTETSLVHAEESHGGIMLESPSTVSSTCKYDDTGIV